MLSTLVTKQQPRAFLLTARALSSTAPSVKPADARFGSGPCKKRPQWTLQALEDTPVGRSHRSKIGKSKLKEAIDKTKEVLGVPSDYHVGIVPGSDTGAFEMAMWSVLGEREIDCFQWESFGKGWAADITGQLKLQDTTKVYVGDYGKLPDLAQARKDADIVFTYNGTTSGVRVPNGDWIASDRTGLTLCDATSAAFAMEMPWDKLDITTYSWQKVLGGEGGHGMLILSPRAVERLESYTPSWPMPKVFRLTKGGKLQTAIFEGSTINTPSMLCVEDYIDALDWAKENGGVAGLQKISERNLEIVKEWVNSNSYASFLAEDESTISCTSICLSLSGISKDGIKKMTALLENENVAVDIGSYRDAPAGLRIWGGATVENSDMEKLMPWLSHAYETCKDE
mmetsp:Transcript_6602/g.12190  ORF Transcript_6602/g.12190 Transcript_6602/m.12190 type:complete len:398 (+) Transcript_6602:113-1306(+)|eukprot:CAMPEP_0184540612 /NCGR_PEP_ID=MMETSP0199_2-20130426/805_1 /TAXON_ID=1112570 /ORGANISM="Thraustochytrium sp., Strain LLF1b" /LENGTH=397 /DNA_ID=CAMNT_0026934239 /DNA_START=110 /DNA_END=1303 /DNA_ORIENTATION=-